MQGRKKKRGLKGTMQSSSITGIPTRLLHTHTHTHIYIYIYIYIAGAGGGRRLRRVVEAYKSRIKENHVLFI